MIEAFFDGACIPNPGGLMSFGVVVYQDNIIIKQIAHRYNPPSLANKTTNNIAEYCGLISALKYLVSIFALTKKITVYGDSQLVIKQMRGEWKINDGAYKPFAIQAQTLVNRFSNITFTWIPREQNFEADRLAASVIYG
jgi:ribonuclease HI